MARTKSSKGWVRQHIADPYVRQARAEGMRSRAAYKLQQIAARDRLFAPGMTVVDLGAAPGGWSQVAARAVAPGGRVYALDLLEFPPLAGVTPLRGNFSDETVLCELERHLAAQPVDLVLSDMAPNISGVAAADQARTMALAELALEFALKHLKPQGKFLVKVFHGAGFDGFLRVMRERFEQVAVRKPEASRSRSSEVYLLGKCLKRSWIALVLMTVFNQFSTRQTTQKAMEYSQFIDEVKQGRIAKVTIEGRVLKGVKNSGERFTTYSPSDPWLVSDLLKNGVIIEAKPEEEPSLLMNIFVSWFPMLLLIGVWIFFMRQMQGGGRGGAFSFGKSRARMLDESNNTVTFADVAGCEEAKEEVAELVEFLRDPSKFQKLGGRIPRGVLMVGNPGTGKTLLARAIAGEAKVPF
ncbi:MAG: ATP-dependent metalloprotease FtsH [Burkholderiales bacterium]|nr:ATP-dependent metalloprotease FtsH [Burkholderiales bacterium]